MIVTKHSVGVSYFFFIELLNAKMGYRIDVTNTPVLVLLLLCTSTHSSITSTCSFKGFASIDTSSCISTLKAAAHCTIFASSMTLNRARHKIVGCSTIYSRTVETAHYAITHDSCAYVLVPHCAKSL